MTRRSAFAFFLLLMVGSPFVLHWFREAAGQPAISSLPTSAAPSVDGTLSPGEWSNKVVVSMNGFNDPNRTRQADLYVMHDATNLYVAVVFPNSAQNADFSFARFRGVVPAGPLWPTSSSQHHMNFDLTNRPDMV